MSDLRTLLASLPSADRASGDAVRARAASILRPVGALARLDDLAAWVAEWQRTPRPTVSRPAALIAAADHGVAAAGVSAYPIEVTAAMLAAFRAHRSTITAFADVVGASVTAIDVGVGRPTADFRVEPAMSPDRFDECAAIGAATLRDLDTDLLVVGEMGIGNTTAAAAVCAALLGGDVSQWVGRGTGVDDEGLTRKIAAVTAGVQRVERVTDPLEVLRELGGAEMVAITGAVLEARRRGIPVLLDGYVVTASVLPLARTSPGSLDHCRVGHCSAEPGHRLLLRELGSVPLLDLDMRLGEASGAMAAVPLVRMACAGITEVPTFDEWLG